MKYKHVFYFTGIVENLSKSAFSRVPLALAQSTNRAYGKMFRTYLAFLVFVGILPFKVNEAIFLAFMECLMVNKVSHVQIQNYVSAIRHFSLTYNLPVKFLQHHNVKMYLKSLKKNAPLSVKLHNIIDSPLLHDLISKCDFTYMGTIFKTAYLIAYFVF